MNEKFLDRLVNYINLSDIMIKLVIIGNSAVGKSCILMRYAVFLILKGQWIYLKFL